MLTNIDSTIKVFGVSKLISKKLGLNGEILFFLNILLSVFFVLSSFLLGLLEFLSVEVIL
jgi:hypothetical protein